MTEPLVERTDEGGVATLSLNRPQALNALSPALFVELRSHLERLANQPDDIGCIVLRGNGRSFSAGNDLKAIDAGEKAPDRYFQAETLDLLENLPQVSIAAVQGHCYTGALELALACDLMVVATSARIADTHGKWAMTPTWGMTQRLPRRVGLLRAKQVMFTGATYSGTEAVAMGLANEAVDDDALDSRAAELAAQIAANSWHTLRGEKMLLREGQARHFEAGLKFEREQSPGVGPDMAERLAAGFGKKK